MSDFQVIEWVKCDNDGDLARELRKNIRQHRREKGRAGHRFAFTFLKTLWVADDDHHAVLNHVDDTVWQMWYRHPVEGWVLISWHATRREAQAAAESSHPQLVVPKVRIHPGINVLAGWPGRELNMRVACSSEYTADVIGEIFAKLGCGTRRELVSAKVI